MYLEDCWNNEFRSFQHEIFIDTDEDQDGKDDGKVADQRTNLDD
jgi:hypothetical protein